MPTYDGEIDDFTVGDDLDIVRTVSAIPDGQTIVRAWFTVKVFEASPTALFQKEITTSLSDDGIISDNELTFTLTPDDTALLSGDNRQWYDIQVETSAGKFYTPERGTITGRVNIST
jgi:hypothetical protein